MPAILTLLAALALASSGGPSGEDPSRPITAPPSPPAAPPADSFKPDPAWKPLGPDIWFDPRARRVVIRARVAIQDGALEHLLCRRGFKDHESILTTEAPARMIHAGLILVADEPGHPVRFEPKFEPPAGPAIAIGLEWEQDGKLRKADAREWVKDAATGEVLKRDWVFAGSELFEDPQSKKMIYAADDGDFITVANFPSSILDLPFRSSANDADRGFVAHAGRVPVRGTPVTMYLTRRNPPARDEAKEKAKEKPKAAPVLR